jgi:alpha-glucosidase
MVEAYSTLENQIRWYGTNERLGVHVPFNFALIANLNRNSTAADIKSSVDGWLGSVPSFGEGNWVLGNHDRARLSERYGENRHESLAIMTFLLPGINVVYYVCIFKH